MNPTRPTGIYHPQWANINFDALGTLGISYVEYAMCYTFTEYQSRGRTGWVECGAANSFHYIYPLKMFISNRMYLSENKFNYRFRALVKKGFIEVSDDKQRFKVLPEKFKVFVESATDEQSKEQQDFEAQFLKNQKVKAKIPFTESPLYNDFKFFKDRLLELKVSPVTDFQHYHDHFRHYYGVENDFMVYKDWDIRFKDWINKDQRKGDLVLVKPKKETKETEVKAPTPSVQKPIEVFIEMPDYAALSDEAIKQDLNDLYKELLEPTTVFDKYLETAEKFKAVATESLRRSDILAEEWKEPVTQLLAIVSAKKTIIEKFFWKRKALQKTPAVSTIVINEQLNDLADKMKKSG
jgi:hypothetical protein